MMNSKSNSKKVLLNKNKYGTTTETSIPNYLKRYKSQEVYLVTGKKNLKLTNMPVSNTITQVITNTPGSNQKNLVTTSTSISTHHINTNLLANSSESTGKTSSKPKKKAQSPESSKVSSKINNYLNNKPRQNQKMPTVSKIMQDESIQELDTEENSKIKIVIFLIHSQ